MKKVWQKIKEFTKKIILPPIKWFKKMLSLLIERYQKLPNKKKKWCKAIFTFCLGLSDSPFLGFIKLRNPLGSVWQILTDRFFTQRLRKYEWLPKGLV